MEDLLQSQIKEHCKLTLPQGLKELMSDISREVLRAQPSNIYKFIPGYLSALLVTRDNLYITAQVCTDTCECDYETALLNELRAIGLDETDVEAGHKVIMKYLKKETVCEGNLISVLMRKTEIDPSQLPGVLNAVRTAYMYQHAVNTKECEISSVNEDVITCATAHTLKLYSQPRPTQEMCHNAANIIKASYRTYGVRSQIDKKYYPESKETSISKQDFQTDETETESTTSSMSVNLKSELELRETVNKSRITTVSSTSLAGSYCDLPKHKPYNANDIYCLSELEESSDKEYGYIDYTANKPEVSITKDQTRLTDVNSIKSINHPKNTEENIYHDRQIITNHYEGNGSFQNKSKGLTEAKVKNSHEADPNNTKAKVYLDSKVITNNDEEEVYKNRRKIGLTGAIVNNSFTKTNNTDTKVYFDSKIIANCDNDKTSLMNANRLISECLVPGNNSGEENEGIEEFLQTESDHDSSNFVPEEILDSDEFDNLDDSNGIIDIVNNIDRDNDDVIDEVFIKSNLYDSKDPPSFMKR